MSWANASLGGDDDEAVVAAAPAVGGTDSAVGASARDRSRSPLRAAARAVFPVEWNVEQRPNDTRSTRRSPCRRPPPPLRLDESDTAVPGTPPYPPVGGSATDACVGDTRDGLRDSSGSYQPDRLATLATMGLQPAFGLPRAPRERWRNLSFARQLRYADDVSRHFKLGRQSLGVLELPDCEGERERFSMLVEDRWQRARPLVRMRAWLHGNTDAVG